MSAYDELLSHLLKSKKGDELPIITSLSSTDKIIVFDTATEKISTILKANLVEDRFITISSLPFTLVKHKDNTNPANKLTLELYDFIIGATPDGSFINAQYLGGDSTDFTNEAVYTILGDQDLSSYLTSVTAASTYEPLKGVDDNYVTDAEKVVIGNTIGVNTGDQIIPVSGVDFDPVGTDNSDNNAVNSLYSGLASSKQDALVSGTNIKTINGATILGSGDIVISGGASVTPATDTGTVIDLSNYNGTYYNMASPSSSLTYTYSGEVLGGNAKILINTASQPTITGATSIYGDTFFEGENMYMNVFYNGNRVEYYFQRILFLEIEAPTYLNYTDLGLNTLSLSWVNNSVESDYSLERSTDGITFVEIATPSTNYYNDTGLTASTDYYYKVKVKSTNSESSYSNILYVKTSNTETVTLTDKMSVAGSVAPAFNKSVYGLGIKALVDNSIYSQIDFLNLFSAHSEIAALLNWVSTSFNSTKGGAPTFTANRGFKGNGTNGYVRTSYNPSVDAVNLLQNNAMVSIFTLETTQENAQTLDCNSDTGTKRILLNPKNGAGNYSVRLNSSSSSSGSAGTNLIGLHTLVRTSSTGFSYYFNGVLISSFTSTSSLLPNADMFSLAGSTGNTADTFSNRQAALIFAGSGNIDQATFYNSIKEMMMLSTGFSPTIWGGALTGNYTALSGVGQTFVTTWSPTAINDKAYNHHPFIIEHGGAIHLIYSTGNTDEDASGQWCRYQKSTDGGATFSTPIELLEPQDAVGGYAASRRVTNPTKLIVVDSELYAIIDVLDMASGAGSARTGIGILAIKINSDATFDTPFWILNRAGTTSAPTPKSGYPSYSFNTLKGSKIINAMLNSENAPTWMEGVPNDNPLYTNKTYLGVGLVEPTSVKLPNGLYMKLWRILNSTAKKIAQYSLDGINWGGLNVTNIPDWSAGSRSDLLKCTDGRIVLVGNNGTVTNRTPLFYAQSADGLEFKSANIFNIDTETTGPVYAGTFKTTGVQYPHLTQLANDKIAVAYSVNKEDIRVSIFDLPTLV